jgi:hypothetical protein
MPRHTSLVIPDHKNHNNLRSIFEAVASTFVGVITNKSEQWLDVVGENTNDGNKGLSCFFD